MLLIYIYSYLASKRYVLYSVYSVQGSVMKPKRKPQAKDLQYLTPLSTQSQARSENIQKKMRPSPNLKIAIALVRPVALLIWYRSGSQMSSS